MPDINPFDVRILDQARRTYYLPRRHHRMEVISKQLVTGIYRWILQIYLSMARKVTGLTFEDMMNVLLKMANERYKDMDRQLLNILLLEPTVSFILPNVKDPKFSK